MESAAKRILSKKYLCGDLPPRVIIHDILSFYLLNVELCIFKYDSEVRFLLFGRFTRDRARSIWFVFPSVVFSSVFVLLRNQINVDVKKMYDLGLLVDRNHTPYEQKQVLVQLSKNSKKMYSLRSLHLSLDDLSFVIKVLEKMKFPNLKTMVIVTSFLDKCLQTNIQNDSVFFNFPMLKYLVLRIEENIDGEISLFRKTEERLSNLEFLELENIFSSYSVSLILPKIVSISMKNVKNVFIIPGEELKYMTWNCRREIESRESRENFKSLIKKSKKLTKLVYCTTSEIVVPFKEIFDASRNQLSSLMNLQIFSSKSSSFKFSPMDVNSFYKLKNQLKFIALGQRGFETDIFCNQEFRSLKALLVVLHPSVESNSEYIWPLSLNLTSLRLVEPQRCDILFSRNEWPLLKELLLLNSEILHPHSFSGEGWNRFPNLKNLAIESVDQFGQFKADTFFSKHDELEELRTLSIKRCALMRGRNWNMVIFNNLEYLEIKGCENINDEIFQKNEFLKLKKLTVSNCRSLTGKEWKMMNSLEYLDIERCGFGKRKEDCFSFCNRNVEISLKE